MHGLRNLKVCLVPLCREEVTCAVMNASFYPCVCTSEIKEIIGRETVVLPVGKSV